MGKKELKQPVFLCGMMGSGKSTVGKALASMLGTKFHDLDEMIVKKAGISIPEIFEQHGESYFRSLERQLLIKESQSIQGIMALGGGALQDQLLVDHIKIYGWLVFLNATKSVILERIAGDRNRPMLTDTKESQKQLETTVDNLLEQRHPFYSQAQIKIDIGSDNPQQIAKRILKKLKIYEGFHRR